MRRFSQIRNVGVWRGPSRWFAFSRSLQALLVVVSAALFITGTAFADSYIALFGVFSLFIANIMYGAFRLRTRSLFLFLHFGIFLFWLTRPFISLIYGSDAWQGSLESTSFSLSVIYLTMICLVAGNELYELSGAGKSGSSMFSSWDFPSFDCRRMERKESERRRGAFGLAPSDCDWKRILRWVSLFVFVVAAAAALYKGYSMLSYMQGMLYEEYFLTSESAYVSSSVSSLAAMLPYAMCAYLATFPKRLPSTIVLLANVAVAVPELLIGTRGSFVLAVVFLAFYYLLRNTVDKSSGEGAWIGRREILLVALGLPVGVFAMGMITYLRDVNGVGPEGILLALADSLHMQGVTFKTLQYGYDVMDSVNGLGFRGYSFGSLIDAVTQGFIGQLFLGCDLLPTTNSVELATQGSYYSHAMSYFAHSNYLGGEGYGSAYVMELFADFGYAGVVLGSLFLGFAFAWLSERAGKSWLVTVFCLMAARKVFHMPRGEFAEWISCLWSTRFWLCIVGIVFVSLVVYWIGRKVRMGTLKPVKSEGAGL